MRRLLLAFTFAMALAGAAQAQSVTCRDGTMQSGPNPARSCVTHGGLPPGPAGNPFSPGQQPATGLPADTQQTARQPRPAPRGAAQGATPAPGGGPGQVWVNASSKAYHCPGTRYYGTTKRGEYMTEAAAKAGGAHAAGGRACS